MNSMIQRHNMRLEKAPRAVRACVQCHARKVRCDVSLSKPQCTNCQFEARRCEPRMRQRRSHASAKPAAKVGQSLRTTRSVSPQPGVLEVTATTAQSTASQTSRKVTLEESTVTPQRQAADDAWTSEHQEAHPGPSPASQVSVRSSPYENGYVGRSLYIAPESCTEEVEGENPYKPSGPSELHYRILGLQKALEYPPKAIRDGLFENFWTYCYPWEPIIEKSEIMGQPLEKVSPLLLQTILLAGSRMSSSSSSIAITEDFYHKAKLLFYLDHEQNPLFTLMAATLMHWWNPHGPERVSINTSSFWCRTAVSLAQQMGLHSRQRRAIDESRCRKIWWSIVARDCLISTAHGRPPAINLDDCDIARPTIGDFPNSTLTGLLFIAYVDLAIITGRFTVNMLRRHHTKTTSKTTEDSLYRWRQTLPDVIRLPPPPENGWMNETLKSHRFCCQQVHVLYYVNLILLYRSPSLEGAFPPTAVIAASTIAGILEEFTARDEVRLLGPVFCFYLLAAAIALLSCYRYTDIWTIACQDIQVITQAQEELKKKWPSALGSIRSFERIHKIAFTMEKTDQIGSEATLSREHAIFFQDTDKSLCRLWDPLQAAETATSKSYCAHSIATRTSAVPLAVNKLSVHGFEVQPQISSNQAATVFDSNDFDYMFQGNEPLFGGGTGDWLFWDEDPQSIPGV